MYKNQLQELAQRSCFNLPSYTCVREGPDHAPSFKAVVNFNGEIFESPQYCTTLRQAEHSAAEAALATLSSRGPSHSLAARILDETGVYKNLLQEIAQRAGSPLPHYTISRSGLSHFPVFTGKVELAGITFRGQPAKSKKQAEKNAALAAWMSLKKMAQQDIEKLEITISSDLKMKLQAIISSILSSSSSFQQKVSAPSSPQCPMAPVSKMLPLFYHQLPPQNRPPSSVSKDGLTLPPFSYHWHSPQTCEITAPFFAVGGALYAPIIQCGKPFCHGIAPPVTLRTSMPVFSAPPLSPTPNSVEAMQRHAAATCMNLRPAVFAAAPTGLREDLLLASSSLPPARMAVEEGEDDCDDAHVNNTVFRCLEQLEI